MTPPNPQPALPAEGAYTETERLFIAEEPPSTFPGNQHSNWGLLRSVLTDEMQIAVDDLNSLFNEIFIDTASAYLSDWEREMGLPVSTSLTDPARRTTLAARKIRSPFTRTRVKTLIERYINDTFGSPAEFGVAGIPLTGAGIPLYAEAGSVPTLYRVYEDIQNFAYTVRVKSSVVPSAALPRELAWITPAHLALTYDNTLANILSYFREIRNDQPVGYWRLGANFNDSSGYGNTGTANGGVAAGGVASPGLLTAVGTDNDAATTFDGVDDFISVANSTLLTIGDQFTIEAWVNATDLAIARAVFSKGDSANHGQYLYVNADGAIRLVDRLGGPVLAGSLPGAVVPGTRYHIVARKSGSKIDVFKNGVNVTFTRPNVYTFLPNTNRITIGETDGGPSLWKGTLDEIALYDFFMTDAQILRHYNTGINVA